jgi:NADPH-dependent 2,4-dienoyl-CoA reductase/sulfur reductase-like enzyme
LRRTGTKGTVDNFELIVIGGGLSSARALKAYREAGASGRAVLISRDDIVPYHRPPLSKRYLRGEAEVDDTLVEPEAFYREHEIELLVETGVARVDPSGHALELEDGRRLGYSRLLLASGAWPRRLDVPGFDLDGVFTLRRLADSTRIRDAARTAKRAVVVGAGFIGMEVAASLRQLDVDVALVHMGRGLFEQLGVPPVTNDFLPSLYRDRGVELVLEDQVEAFEGGSGLARVRTRGGRMLEADMAVVGIGVTPTVGFLEGSGIELDDGIVVNERFETNVRDAYAVGDAARFYDPLFGRHRRIEHWSNANYQGTEVGKILAGQDGGYDTVSSFFSEVFGIVLRVHGDTTQADRLVVRGPEEDGKTAAFFLDANGRLEGALLIAQEDEVHDRVKEAIGSKVHPSEPELDALLG